MQKVNRFWMQGVVMLFVLLLISACSKDEGNSTQPEPPVSNVNETNQEKEEVVIYTMAGDTDEFFNSRWGDALRKKFTNYKITYLTDTTAGISNEDKITKLLASKTDVDLIFATTGFLEKTFFQFGFAYDMTELAKKHDVDFTRFNPAYKDILGTAFGGGIYYFPVQANVPLMFYNKSIFDKFGVPYPSDDLTWDEFYDLVRSLTRTDGEVEYAGYLPSIHYMLRADPMSIPMAENGTGNPTINKDDRWGAFFQKFIVDLLNVNGVDHFKNRNFYQDFLDGTSAIALLVDGNMISSKEPLENLDFDVFAVPTLSEKKLGMQPITVGMGITNISKNKDASMEVLKYIVSDDVQSGLARQGISPVVKSPEVQKLMGSENFFKDKNWGAVFHNEWAPFVYYGPMVNDLYGIYNKYANQVFRGEVDTNTARQKAEEESLKIVETVKKNLVIENIY